MTTTRQARSILPTGCRTTWLATLWQTPTRSRRRSTSIWWPSRSLARAKKPITFAKKKTSSQTPSGNFTPVHLKIQIQGRALLTGAMLTTNCRRQQTRSSNTQRIGKSNSRSSTCKAGSRSATTRRKVPSFHMSTHSSTRECTCTQLMNKFEI